MNSPILMYAGPTLFGTDIDISIPEDISGIRWLPPVKRGDIEALLKNGTPPGIIGLADGTFHSFPSVGHDELRLALEAGWKIMGLCSMGAIRASEMAHMGLIPYGMVAKQFCEDPNFADDEVTLLHSTDAPYLPMSEPLIHMRAFLSDMQARGHISHWQESLVLDSLLNRWYGNRTLPALKTALEVALDTKDLPGAVTGALSNFEPYRIKQADLMQFVRTRAWQSSN